MTDMSNDIKVQRNTVYIPVVYVGIWLYLTLAFTAGAYMSYFDEALPSLIIGPIRTFFAVYFSFRLAKALRHKGNDPAEYRLINTRAPSRRDGIIFVLLMLSGIGMIISFISHVFPVG
ncbi:hypothetical protein ACGYLO_12775 [Sulfitobacter sp. 1A13353]|uniref:hypothetical protein n=1 Tax=Sulfitobacter sp. 1A13353 TaxID=3368568 RepID=UPI003745663C